MKLQAAQIMCSNEGLHTNLTTNCIDHGSIELDVFARKLNIVGIRGQRKTPEEVEAALQERKAAWKPRQLKYRSGVLRLFSELAASPMKGAYLDYSRFGD